MNDVKTLNMAKEKYMYTYNAFFVYCSYTKYTCKRVFSKTLSASSIVLKLERTQTGRHSSLNVYIDCFQLRLDQVLYHFNSKVPHITNLFRDIFLNAQPNAWWSFSRRFYFISRTSMNTGTVTIIYSGIESITLLFNWSNLRSISFVYILHTLYDQF